MKEKFLPIGSVVMLNGGTKPIMIISYCIFPKNTEKNEKKMFEYGGCTYPEGLVDSNLILAFDHSQIAEIIYTGYETEEQTNLSNGLINAYDKYKAQFEKEGNFDGLLNNLDEQ